MSNKADIIRLIRKTLIADSGVNSLVAQRVYPAHISSVKDPVLPCITLFYQQGQSDPNEEIGWKIILFQFWSDKQQEDCYDIEVAVWDCLKRQRIFDDDHYLIIYRGMDEGILTDKSENDKTRYYQSVYYRFYSVSRN